MRPVLIYKQLLKKYGPQGWWPVFVLRTTPGKPLFKNPQFQIPNSKSFRFENDLCYGIEYGDLKKHKEEFRDPFFEIAVGAILTQNTAWRNVARAITALYKANSLIPKKLLTLPNEKLQELIRPAGYYRQKEKKLRLFAGWLRDEFEGDILKLKRFKLEKVREMLLGIWGIGPETADSILLYALDKPVFVVDAYTKRLCLCHDIEFKTYDDYQKFFTSQLKANSEMFREYHALIVAWGKEN